MTTVTHTVATSGADGSISGYWIPIGIAVIGGLVTYYVAARNVYINSITVERSKWIDALRKNLAAYDSGLVELVIELETPETAKSEAARAIVRKLANISSLIRLQLNPEGLADTIIMIFLKGMPTYITSAPELKIMRERLLRHSQYLLKAEWEKVKYEARGFIYQIINRNKAMQARRNYLEYCRAEYASMQDDKSYDQTHAYSEFLALLS